MVTASMYTGKGPGFVVIPRPDVGGSSQLRLPRLALRFK